MGNTDSELISWEELKTKATKVDPGNAQEMLLRLNIPFNDSQNNNADNKEENKENNNKNLDEYLKNYLSMPANESILNELLKRSAINFSLLQNTNSKIESLLIVSSPDFWRTNYKLHPNSSRVRMWLWVHERYRSQIAEFVQRSESLEKDSNSVNKEEIYNEVKAAFEKFDSKLKSHTEFEETMLLKFMKEHLPKNTVPHLDDLHHQHESDIPQLTKKIQQCFENKTKEYKTLASLLKEYQKALLDHLQFEEQNLVGVWLNLTNELYKTYRSYLSWKYAPMY